LRTNRIPTNNAMPATEHQAPATRPGVT
jgi:hypothetical protein